MASQYQFVHALYQEVLYERVAAARRVHLHGKIGERLEAGHTNHTAELSAELAMHFERGRDYPRAVRYLEQAGKNSTQRSAYVEAEQHFAKGIRLLQTFPDTPERAQQELAIQLELGPVLIASRGFGAPEVESAYSRARQLCQQLEDSPELFLVLWGLRRFYNQRAQFKAAGELEEQLFRLAKATGDPTQLLGVQWASAVTLFWIGELRRAHERNMQSLSLYRPDLHASHVAQIGTDLGVAAYAYDTMTLWHLGYPDQALEQSRKGLALAQEVNHPFSLAFARSCSTWLHVLRREVDATHAQAEALLQQGMDQEFPYWVAFSAIHRGWALALHGQAEEGIAQMREGIATHQALGSVSARTWFFTMLAEAYAIAGRTEDGLQVLTEALDEVDKGEEQAYVAELYRLKGQLLLEVQGAKSKEMEAETYFQKAIAVAQHQEAKSWELRAATSLARFWQQQGKRAEAHELLAPVYNWFTEGFETKDLQEAKALLAELSAV